MMLNFDFFNDVIFSDFYDVKFLICFNNEIFSGFYEVKIFLMIFTICYNFVKFDEKSYVNKH